MTKKNVPGFQPVKKTTRKTSENISSPKSVKYGIHIGQLVKEAIESHPTMTINELSRIAGKDSGMWMSHKCSNPHFGSVYDLLFTSIELGVDLVSPLLKVLADYGVAIRTRITIEKDEKMQAEIDHFKDLWERSKREIDILLKLLEDKK